MKTLNLLFLLLISCHSYCQKPVFYPSTWPKMMSTGVKSDTMLNGFCGGFNNPMFYSMDLNGDGTPDMVVYDRSDNSVMTFINNRSTIDPEFYFAPEYETAFPPYTAWAEMYDFNGDGKPDIFNYSTVGTAQIQVYENNTTIPGHPSFKKYADPLLYNYNPNKSGDTPYAPTKVILSVNTLSSPAIGDVDGNGATSMLAYDFTGSGALDYYRNFIKDSLAKYPYIKDKDSLWLGLASEGWGYFDISNANSQWYLQIQPDTSLKIPKTSMHVGATALMIDLNGDGAQDLLLGDYDDPHMYAFINGKVQYAKQTSKTRDSFCRDSITEVDTFPTAANPVLIRSMPAAYWLDVDNDGIKDLLISPFEISPLSYSTIDRHNFIWYYKNIGTNKKPDFVFKANNYMENNVLDLGIHAAPCFINYFTDSLPDMIVAHTYVESLAGFNVSNYAYGVTGLDKLDLYKNIGTKNKAVYQLVDTDFLSIGKDSLYNVIPTVGDLNGDGKPDIVLGSFNGKLVYLENTTPAGTKGSMQFTQKPGVLDSIVMPTYPGNSAPAIGDIDADGNADLVVGANDGNLRYYRNIGTNGKPLFSSIPTNSALGKIDTRYTWYYHNSPTDSFKVYGPAGLGVPCLANINRKNKKELDLLVGTFNNGLLLYLNVQGHGNPGDSLPRCDSIIYDKLNGRPGDEIMGGKLCPAVAELDDDTMPDIMVGCTRGGLMFLGTQQHKLDTINYISAIKPVAAQPVYAISVYPNPAYNNLTIKYSGDASLQSNYAVVSDITGKTVLTQQLNLGTGSRQKQINLTGFSRGVYLINIYTISGERIYYGRVVVE